MLFNLITSTAGPYGEFFLEFLSIAALISIEIAFFLNFARKKKDVNNFFFKNSKYPNFLSKNLLNISKNIRIFVPSPTQAHASKPAQAPPRTPVGQATNSYLYDSLFRTLFQRNK